MKAKVWDFIIAILTTYYILLLVLKLNYRADSVMYALIYCAVMYNAALKQDEKAGGDDADKKN